MTVGTKDFLDLSSSAAAAPLCSQDTVEVSDIVQ